MNRHTADTWFKNTNVLDYFEKEFQTNTIGKFRIPSKVRRLNFPGNSALTKPQLQEIINKLANLAINVISQCGPARKLKVTYFSWLLDFTQFELRQAVCSMIQAMVLNNQVYEVRNTVSAQSPTFTINSNITGWLLSSDPINTFCKNNITKSGISNYDVITENEYLSSKPNGNTYIVGRIPLDVMKKLKI